MRGRAWVIRKHFGVPQKLWVYECFGRHCVLRTDLLNLDVSASEDPIHILDVLCIVDERKGLTVYKDAIDCCVVSCLKGT